MPLSQRANSPKKRAPNRPARKPAKPKPTAKPAAEQDGLPAALTAALASNGVVVVSLYAPGVDLDELATAEARAGAAEAGAGFVALNVLSEAEVKPLAKQLGVLEDPAVLVYRRPAELMNRFAGFVDKQTVLQAARNAGL